MVFRRVPALPFRSDRQSGGTRRRDARWKEAGRSSQRPAATNETGEGGGFVGTGGQHRRPYDDAHLRHLHLWRSNEAGDVVGGIPVVIRGRLLEKRGQEGRRAGTELYLGTHLRKAWQEAGQTKLPHFHCIV